MKMVSETLSKKFSLTQLSYIVRENRCREKSHESVSGGVSILEAEVMMIKKIIAVILLSVTFAACESSSHDVTNVDAESNSMNQVAYKFFELTHESKTTCLRVSDEFHPILLSDGSLRINYSNYGNFDGKPKASGYGSHIAIVVAHKNQAQQLGAIAYFGKDAISIEGDDDIYIVRSPPKSPAVFLKDELLSLTFTDVDVDESSEMRLEGLKKAVHALRQMITPCA